MANSKKSGTNNLIKNNLINSPIEILSPFSAAVSNPPYQRDANGAKEQIYKQFVIASKMFSASQSIVCPENWTNSWPKDHMAIALLGEQLKVYTFSAGDLFTEGVPSSLPIDIIYATSKASTEFFVNDHKFNWHVKHFPKNSLVYSAWLKTREFYDGLKLPEQPLTKVTNVETAVTKFQETSDGIAHPICVYIKKSPGKQPDARLMYCDKFELLKEDKQADIAVKYRVVIRARIKARISIFEEILMRKNFKNLGAEIYHPGTIHTGTLLTLKTFEHLDEAKNFQRYINTKFCTAMLSLDVSGGGFGQTIPDLDDYSNHNSLFKGDLSQNLYDLFELSKDEIDAIENFVAHMVKPE